MSWLERILKRAEPAPLRGAPAVRRQKNYAAETGYAYEYFYEGMRDVEGGEQYCFAVSGDRKSWLQTAVTVPAAGVGAWESAHGRALAGNERYAIAKLALFAAFDARDCPAEMREPVCVTPGQVEEFLARLGVD